jgi:tRNA nucleotidyltransferase (CCA-adding enzyme)
MIKDGVLKELPKERIFEEFKKLLLKSQHPSIGIKLLKELGGFDFFDELKILDEESLAYISKTIDRAASFQMKSDKEKLILMLALLTSQLKKEQQNSFLYKLTNEKKILSSVEKLTDISFDIDKQTNYSIYKLATKIDIAFYAHYLLALYPHKKLKIAALRERAKKLNVYHKPLPPLLEGKDLIALGLQPSKAFSKILNEIYEKQLHAELSTKEDVINYLNRSSILS